MADELDDTGNADINAIELDPSKLESDLEATLKDAQEHAGESEEEQAARAAKAEAEKGKSEDELKAEADAKAKEDDAAKAKAEAEKLQNKNDDLDDLDDDKKVKFGKQKPKADVKIEGDDKVKGLLDDAAPTDLSEQGAKDWGALKDKANITITEQDSTIKERDATITDLRKRANEGSDSEAMETLKKENADLANKIHKVDVKNSPQFLEKYTLPKEKMFAALDALLKEHEVKVDTTHLLSLKGKELSAAVETIVDALPSYDRGDVVDTIKAYKNLTAEENGVLDNAKLADDEMRKQFAGFAEETFATEFKAIASEEGRMVEHRVSPTDASDEVKQQDIEYNASVDKMEEVARAIATGDMDQKKIAHVAAVYAWAGHLYNHGLPQIGADHNAMVKQFGAWKAEIQKIKEANPNMNVDSLEVMEKKTKELYAAGGEYKDSDMKQIVQEQIIDARK